MTDKRFLARFPPDMHAWLEKRSQQENESMNRIVIRAVRREMEASRDDPGALAS